MIARMVSTVLRTENESFCVWTYEKRLLRSAHIDMRWNAIVEEVANSEEDRQCVCRAGQAVAHDEEILEDAAAFLIQPQHAIDSYMNLLACPASLSTLLSAALRIAIATVCLLLVTLGHAHAGTACRTEPVQPCPGWGSEGHAACHYEQRLPPCDEPVESGQFEGVLVEGHSEETLILTIRRDGGTPVQVWCPEVCGKLSGKSADGNGREVKKAYLGRRVRVTVATERNGGRVPGADKDDELLFAKKISFVK